jgi:hypothetical protein
MSRLGVEGKMALAVGRLQDNKAGNSISRIESNESFSDFVSSRLGKALHASHRLRI